MMDKCICEDIQSYKKVEIYFCLTNKLRCRQGRPGQEGYFVPQGHPKTSVLCLVVLLLQHCHIWVLDQKKRKVGSGEEYLSFKDTTQKMYASPLLMFHWRPRNVVFDGKGEVMWPVNTCVVLHLEEREYLHAFI